MFCVLCPVRPRYVLLFFAVLLLWQAVTTLFASDDDDDDDLSNNRIVKLAKQCVAVEEHYDGTSFFTHNVEVQSCAIMTIILTMADPTAAPVAPRYASS